MQVYDAESAHGKTGLRILIIAFIVRATVADGIIHPF
jgi:hypothetical protein